MGKADAWPLSVAWKQHVTKARMFPARSRGPPRSGKGAGCPTPGSEGRGAPVGPSTCQQGRIPFLGSCYRASAGSGPWAALGRGSHPQETEPSGIPGTFSQSQASPGRGSTVRCAEMGLQCGLLRKRCGQHHLVAKGQHSSTGLWFWQPGARTPTALRAAPPLDHSPQPHPLPSKVSGAHQALPVHHLV